MFITYHIILQWVELGGILFLASYFDGYYAYPHNDSFIVILQAIIPRILSRLSRPTCPF